MDLLEYDDLTRLLLTSAATGSWPRCLQDVSIVRYSFFSCLFIRVCRNMVFHYTVTLLMVPELALSNINNSFCREPDDTVSYCHDTSDQAHLSADRGNLDASQEFTALVAEATSQAKEEEAFVSCRFQVTLAEIARRHDEEMAALGRLNAKALTVLANMADKTETPSRPLRKRKEDNTATNSPPNPPKKKEK